DRAYPVEGRLLPGAGTIVAAIEVATGANAVCVGKPEPFLFQEGIRRAGRREARERVVVVGDSTDYDMVAAHRVGAAGVLITTGLTERNALDTASGEAVPDRVIHSLEELFGLPEFAGSENAKLDSSQLMPRSAFDAVASPASVHDVPRWSSALRAPAVPGAAYRAAP